MKIMLLTTLFFTTFNLWAKPVVMVSYFDAFGRAPFNNSEVVARSLLARFSSATSPFEVKLCRLETKYEKAFAQIETCKKELAEAPVMILGLGESNCELKLEVMMRNKDKTYGPDNGGVERDNTTIIPEAPAVLGMTLPLPDMYCALGSRERRNLTVSSNAGSFVCNNMAFQMSYYYPEISFGFVHVPAQNCRKLERRTEESTSMLERMLIAAVSKLSVDSTAARLPVSRNSIREIRSSQTDECHAEFYDRIRSFDK